MLRCSVWREFSPLIDRRKVREDRQETKQEANKFRLCPTRALVHSDSQAGPDDRPADKKYFLLVPKRQNSKRNRKQPSDPAGDKLIT